MTSKYLLKCHLFSLLLAQAVHSQYLNPLSYEKSKSYRFDMEMVKKKKTVNITSVAYIFFSLAWVHFFHIFSLLCIFSPFQTDWEYKFTSFTLHYVTNEAENQQRPSYMHV